MSTTVNARASSGIIGRTLSTADGNVSLRNTPKSVGNSTSCMVDTASPHASTGMNCPAKRVASAGVMTAAARVDTVVIRTDKATSPPATKVATLDACPPGHDPSMMRPVAIAGGRFISLARVKARMGRRAY